MSSGTVPSSRGSDCAASTSPAPARRSRSGAGRTTTRTTRTPAARRPGTGSVVSGRRRTARCDPFHWELPEPAAAHPGPRRRHERRQEVPNTWASSEHPRYPPRSATPRSASRPASSPGRPAAASSPTWARPACWSRPPRRAVPRSTWTSSRSPWTTRSGCTPPARSPAASSSVRDAPARTRSSPAGWWTGRCGRRSPRACATRSRS